MRTLKHQPPRAAPLTAGARGRPVLLATMDVPFDQAAVVFAVDSAVELGQRLIVANFVERAPLPLSAMLEVAAEQGAGIFVFGPDRSRIRRLRYRRAARVIRSRVTALVWLAE